MLPEKFKQSLNLTFHRQTCLMLLSVFLLTLTTSNAEAFFFKRKLEKQFDKESQLSNNKLFEQCSMPLVKQFYEQRHWKTLWDNKRFNGLIENIEELQNDGLKPEDFWLSQLKAYRKVSKKDDKYLERELLATCSLFKAIDQLRYGRIAQSSLNPNRKPGKKPLDDTLFINRLRLGIQKGDINQTFDKARPALPSYSAMRKELANLRAQAANTETPDANVEAHIKQIRVNQERMRWYFNNLPQRYVLVNIAAYDIALMEREKPLWTSRVQVGQTYRKTPVIHSNINRITINPRWTIPPTIFTQDSLPAIRKDSTYLKRNHIRIYDQEWNELDEDSINWDDPGDIFLVQDAGPGGALGQIAIRFPNDFAVYLHETPHNELFEKKRRAFSSGCIRVENIRELAVLLMDDSQHWSRSKLEEAIANGKTFGIKPPKEIPIYITYITVKLDKQGQLQYLPDIYNQDTAILKALNKH